MKMHKLIYIIYILLFCSIASYAQNINLAKNCLVTCSNGTNPEYAVDGNRGGWFWEANLKSVPCWLEVDLGDEYEIDEINLFMWWGDKRFYQYFVEVSPDRKNWQEVIDERKNTISPSSKGRIYKISPTKARFIRLTVTTNTVNEGVHVREIEILGKKK